jgi:hypothetical protein
MTREARARSLARRHSETEMGASTGFWVTARAPL